MAWEREIAGQFPPSREGEPPNLRGDIADELADHLACSAEKEMERGEDESVARRTALDRFGDPAAMARKLWMDAMKERIMKDRLLLAACLLLAIVAIGAAGLAWRATNQGEARMATALEAASKSNAALLAALDKMQAPSAATAPVQGADKAMLVYKVTKDGKPDSEPVEGIGVELHGHPFTDRTDVLDLTTDSEGRAAFGPIRPGQYTLIFQKMLGGISPDYSMKRTETVLLFSGQLKEATIEDVSTSPVKTTFAIDWPERLKNRGFAAKFRLEYGKPGAEASGPWKLADMSSILLDDQNRMYFVYRDRIEQHAVALTPDDWDIAGGGVDGYPGFAHETNARDVSISSEASRPILKNAVLQDQPLSLRLAPGALLMSGDYWIYDAAILQQNPELKDSDTDEFSFHLIMPGLNRVQDAAGESNDLRAHVLSQFRISPENKEITLKLNSDQIDAIDRRAKAYDAITKPLNDEAGANAGQTSADAK